MVVVREEDETVPRGGTGGGRTQSVIHVDKRRDAHTSVAVPRARRARSPEKTPTYTLGAIAGQNGWGVFNAASSFDLVQTRIVKSGTQALAITPNGTMPATSAIQLISVGFPVVGTFTRNVWHRLDFLFDFTAQTYSFVFDGSTLSTATPGCRDNGTCTSATPVLAYGNTLFDVFATLNSNDLGVIDNLSVSTVPEPGLFLLVGAGLAFLPMKSRLSRRSRE